MKQTAKSKAKSDKNTRTTQRSSGCIPQRLDFSLTRPKPPLKLIQNRLLVTAMQKMACAKISHNAELEKETHKYCKFLAGSEDQLSVEDIRNVKLHLADFHFIREQFNTLFLFQSFRERNEAAEHKASTQESELLKHLHERVAHVDSLIKHFETAALRLHSRVVNDNKSFINFVSSASRLVDCKHLCHGLQKIPLEDVIAAYR